MTALAAFFGTLCLVAILACGLLWVASPAAGREVARRVGVSLALFVAASLVLPGPGSGIAAGAVRLVFGSLLAFAAVWYLFAPAKARAIIGGLALGAGALLVASIVGRELAGSGTGWPLLLATTVWIVAALWRRSGRRQ